MPQPGEIERGVLFGYDGYLFLLDGSHHVFDLMLGIRRISEESFTNFKRNILRRSAICAKSGAKFAHVIFPDKQSVVLEKIPVEDPICLTDIYLNRLPCVRQSVLSLRDVLRNSNELCFMKKDTHLTEMGNIIAAGAIVEWLTGASQADHVNGLISSGDWVEIEWISDLGNRFQPAMLERKRLIRKSWPHKWFHNEMNGGNNGIVDILFSADARYRKRLLVFGDSFARDVCGILSYFFSEVVFLRTQYFHDDVFEQIRPDLVITSQVERYLSFCEDDDLRPSFFMYPYLNELEYKPNKEFAEAFTATLSYGRPPYFDFIKKHGFGGLLKEC